MKTSSISCEVCLDLIPLVRDHVASEDSVRLVNSHMQNCQSCQRVLGSETSPNDHAIDDQKIINTIRRSLTLLGGGLLVMGGVLGIVLSNGMGMFYNFLLMPMIGALGYFIFNKKWPLVLIGVFLSSYIWIIATYMMEGALEEGIGSWLFTSPLLLTGIYSFLVALGVAIAALLKFAFKKEKVE